VGTTLPKLLILRHTHEKKALEVIDAARCSAPCSDTESLLIIA